MKKRKGQEKKRIPLYRRCVKCGGHAYLTVGKFYFCTNKDCLYKDYLNQEGNDVQIELEVKEDDEEEDREMY